MPIRSEGVISAKRRKWISLAYDGVSVNPTVHLASIDIERRCRINGGFTNVGHKRLRSGTGTGGAVYTVFARPTRNGNSGQPRKEANTHGEGS